MLPMTVSSNQSNFPPLANTSPLIAGTLGGAASTILLYPLDLVKVRLQVNESSPSIHNDVQPKDKSIRTNISTSSSCSYTHSRSNVTIFRMVRGIIRHEGVMGLYSGITPAILGSAMSWGGYFFFYEGMKSKLRQYKHNQNMKSRSHSSITNEQHNKNGRNIQQQQISIKLGPIENFSAACLSGAIMVAFTNPIWLIKTRMQLQMKLSDKVKIQSSSLSATTTTKVQPVAPIVQEKIIIKPPYKNMFDAARTIVKEEGFFGLYKGSIPALMLVSHGGVQFVVYEFLKGHFGVYQKAVGAQNSRNNSVFTRLSDSLGYLTMGAISKIVATTATYPLQVIKARLQQRATSTQLSASGEIQIVNRQYNGVVDCAKRIWINEGLYGFFKGSLPNAIRVAPSSAITFVVYESVMDIMSSSYYCN